MADRYCSNCGKELAGDARFCSSCGRPVHEVAHVPTPEADEPVPPLPSPLYRPANTGATDSRELLMPGAPQPISDAERSRLLDEEVGLYMQEGFVVRQRTPTTAQLVKPKQFSFIWAFLWFFVFGFGLAVYLIYYAAKKDEGRYVEVDEYGAIRATHQAGHLL